MIRRRRDCGVRARNAGKRCGPRPKARPSTPTAQVRMTLLHDVCLQTGHFELQVAEFHGAAASGAEFAGRHEHQASSNFMGNTAAVAAAMIACVGLLAIARHRLVRARQRRGINVGALRRQWRSEQGKELRD